MSKTIKPEEYAKLEGIDTLGWTPVYKGWKTKKQRAYHECEDGYTHFIGWETITTPIGEPLHYKYHKPTAMEISNYHMAEMWSKRMLRSATDDLVFNTEPMNQSKTISFTRYSDDPN